MGTTCRPARPPSTSATAQPTLSCRCPSRHQAPATRLPPSAHRHPAPATHTSVSPSIYSAAREVIPKL
ncbi:hypothetical protein I3843_16G055400 [Carya illinoinensis]|nr:hypothetical protein I3843_16G055400 [Carya illinoinensis]